MLFGVPDEITDMTRSLKMVDRKRLIYWMIVFRHRKCSRVIRVFIRVSEGLPEPPEERYGPYGPYEGGTLQPTRGGAPPKVETKLG
jgi:hypothetical protein